ncbi:hypothetical protein [Nonomuraea sp. bgisy101]|uniref:hypothetical protein n=1 Tax=Nonomuraea sp. bgisy101 TaxID=3413784 RepID=UPI003D74B66A
MRPVVLTPGAPERPGWTPVRIPDEVRELVRSGGIALVRLPGQLDAALAAAAVFRWAGAGVFVTEHADQVRLALDMTDSLAGTRAPAVTRRGLA